MIRTYINEKTNYNFKNITNISTNNEYQLCAAIKYIYEHKGPFSILDNVYKYTRYFVNVVKIDGDNIIIECPVTGIKRTESIKNFVKRYNEHDYFKNYGVDLFYIAPKSI